MQVLVFELNNQYYAINTEFVSEISKPLEVRNVPKSPDHIVGLVNLRGNIISLMDLGSLLKLEKKEEEYSHIIIVNMEEELIGISVNQVKEVIDIEEDEIDKLRRKEHEGAIEGIIKLDYGIVNFLNLEKCILEKV
ncbi:MAG: chemotaxis protein CheW [Firmicutes bacterium]|nr:chemotaxis protein CheW [Bacillota bacterium]MTI69508.1 chemotaxis protein CheW [Bacillota bacterium]